MSFNSKWFISDIHRISTGGKPNPKPNPIGFGAPNLKTVGEKSSPNLNPKPADIRPKPDPLPSLACLMLSCAMALEWAFWNSTIIESGLRQNTISQRSFAGSPLQNMATMSKCHWRALWLFSFSSAPAPFLFVSQDAARTERRRRKMERALFFN